MGKKSKVAEELVEPGNENSPDEAPSKTKLKYKDKLKFANAISKPMASKNTTKRLLKLIRKGK